MNKNIIINNKPAIIIKRYHIKDIYEILYENKNCLASKKFGQWMFVDPEFEATMVQSDDRVKVINYYINDVSILENKKTTQFFRNKKHHREDGPASVYRTCSGEVSEEYYYLHGELYPKKEYYENMKWLNKDKQKGFFAKLKNWIF